MPLNLFKGEDSNTVCLVPNVPTKSELERGIWQGRMSRTLNKPEGTKWKDHPESRVA